MWAGLLDIQSFGSAGGARGMTLAVPSDAEGTPAVVLTSRR
jgi:hypothetical protein